MQELVLEASKTIEYIESMRIEAEKVHDAFEAISDSLHKIGGHSTVIMKRKPLPLDYKKKIRSRRKMARISRRKNR